MAGFINFYLSNVNEIIEDVGYFPISEDTLNEAKESWLQITGNEKRPEPRYDLPEVDAGGYSQEDDLIIAGSSTVYPLTRQIAIKFRGAGFPGAVPN